MLKTEPQLNTLSGHVRRFRKFTAWAILLASKTLFLRKILQFFSDFAKYYHLNHIEPSQNRYQLTQKDVFFKVVKISVSYNY